MRAVVSLCTGCLAIASVCGAAATGHDGEGVLTRASAAALSTVGVQYTRVLHAGAGMDNTLAIIRHCEALAPPADMDAMVVSGVVTAGGALASARVMPDTMFTRCFLARYAGQRFPALPAPATELPVALLIDTATGHASNPFTHVSRTDRHGAITEASMPIYAPRPVYPQAALDDGATGKAMVLIVFGSLGTPTDVRMMASTGDPRLDKAALDATRQWVFRPTLGRPLSIKVPISFQLPTADQKSYVTPNRT
ncbi:energy transducer TonB [Luteibacter yeojuensis]|uniref:energy transducer TonB n=1 Tax=Luteibacter yeojuensis TaxID=345309 RepID=UPI000696A070|nr:energy transducer TonB [Luteibacter yeojuensis]